MTIWVRLRMNHPEWDMYICVYTAERYASAVVRRWWFTRKIPGFSKTIAIEIIRYRCNVQLVFKLFKNFKKFVANCFGFARHFEYTPQLLIVNQEKNISVRIVNKLVVCGIGNELMMSSNAFYVSLVGSIRIPNDKKYSIVPIEFPPRSNVHINTFL